MMNITEEVLKELGFVENGKIWRLDIHHVYMTEIGWAYNGKRIVTDVKSLLNAAYYTGFQVGEEQLRTNFRELLGYYQDDGR